MSENMRKVHFKVKLNADGYPPFNSEGMWCIKINEQVFRVDNIPYFVTGVSYADVISVAEDEEGRLNFIEVVEEGGHSTYRVIMKHDGADQYTPDIWILQL